jgi:mannose-1-phosphate guanylyltransferase
MKKSSLFIFLMAGGSGERFWPLSRQSRPKHLQKLLSEKTLLQETLARVQPMTDPDRLFILTNELQREVCLEAVPGFPPDQIIGEPAKRDTAPAAAVATALALTRDPEATCLLLPSDATIHDIESLRRNLSDAAALASSEPVLVTLGIPPTYPSTGFGYLQVAGETWQLPAGSQARRVSKFVEKPDSDTAQDYLNAGHYLWNAGMFAWKAATFLEACSQYAPELAQFIRNFPSEPSETQPFLQQHFSSLEKISIDYALMEKAENVRCVLADFDWDDVGTWTALPAHLPTDAHGNTLRGPVTSVDSHHNIAVSTGRAIALCGVSDLVVVETADAILVCHRSAAQDLKKLQPHLPEELR